MVIHEILLSLRRGFMDKWTVGWASRQASCLDKAAAVPHADSPMPFLPGQGNSMALCISHIWYCQVIAQIYCKCTIRSVLQQHFGNDEAGSCPFKRGSCRGFLPGWPSGNTSVRFRYYNASFPSSAMKGSCCHLGGSPSKVAESCSGSVRHQHRSGVPALQKSQLPLSRHHGWCAQCSRHNNIDAQSTVYMIVIGGY